ncbi:MAG: recombinase family protein [Candidatus Shapirobacteria bacterium]|nr:recombinase family protein [Candidatus Shapirobacteria bacterium]
MKTNQDNSLKYCQYCRKSSESKEKQALSIPDQIKVCGEYAVKNELNIVAKIEESKSSYKPHIRPEFDKILKMIGDKKIDAILTWKLDRLCRNPEEGGILLQLLQDGKIKEIRTPMGDIYTQESDHLILQIHFGMANQYSRAISQNVRRALVCKAERGEFTKPAPLGYEGIGESKSRLIKPHKFEAPLLVQAYELAKSGRYSLSNIQKYLKDNGLKTKRGKDLSKSHLYRILTSSIYYGVFNHNGIAYQGNYEPLINKSTFDEVQIALGVRSKPKKLIWESVYNGLFFCPDCGCAITTVNKKKLIKKTNKYETYTYLVCTHRKGNCQQKPISADDFDKQIMAKIGPLKLTERKWELALKLFRAKNANQNQTQSKFIDNLHLQLKIHQEKLNRLINMRAGDEITAEEFKEQKLIILNEQTRISEAINRYNETNQNWLELSENFINKVFLAKKILSDGLPEEKKKLIDEVGRNLFLNNKKVELTLKEPYIAMTNPAISNNMRAMWSELGTYLDRNDTIKYELSTLFT